MKLKHLLLTAFAVLGMGRASAQIETGDYYIQNVESGDYLSGANSWGTQGSVSPQADMFRVQESGEGYTLTNLALSSGNKTFGYNLFVDTDTKTNGNVWTIAPVSGEDGVYTIYAKGMADGVADKFNGFVAQSTTAGVHIGTVLTSVPEVTDAAKWRFLTKEQAMATLDNATAQNPVRASFLIADANFSRNHNSSVWTVTASNKNLGGGDNNNFCAESYRSEFNIYQDLTVPNGVYTLGAQGFYRQDGNDNEHLPVFYANEATVKFPLKTGSENNMTTASASFTAGEYYSDVVYVKVTDGKLRIGAKLEGNTGLWCIWDNFMLNYHGDCSLVEVELAYFIHFYNEALENAKSYLEANMSDEAKVALQNAISENTIDVTNTTEDALKAARANLEAAVVDAKQAIEEKKVADLVAQGPGTDLTSLIVNPSFETGNLTGWEANKANDTNVYPITNGTYTVSNADGNYVFNTWGGDAEKYVQQTLAYKLPVGNYEVKALIASDANVKINLYANESVAEVLTSPEGKGVGVDGSVITYVSDGTLKIKVASTNWYKADNFRLTYLGDNMPELPALAEGVMNKDIEKAQADAVDAYNANKTVANYDEAVKAIEAAKASVEQYKNNAIALAAQKALVDGTNIYGEGYEAYAAAYAEKQTAYDNRTLNEVVVNPNAATGWHASTEYNFLLTPWTIGGKACNNFDTALYVNTWSVEGETDGSNFTVPFFEYWVGSGSLEANAIETNISDVDNGLYVVSALVRTSHNGDLKPINLTVNNGEAVDVTAGDVIEGTNRYLNTFTAQGLVKDGVLRIKFDVPAESNVSWLSFKNVTYKKERDLNPDELLEWATPDEIAALNAAIEAAEANTLGFQKGEFAPYNNIEAIKAVAAAKAITEPAEKSVVADAQKALEEAVWTENTEEVNAVYDGQFTLTTAQEGGYLVPTGWTNLGYNTRVYNQTNKGANAGVGDEAGCLFAKFETSYGTVEGYTMPLKAGVYSLKFNYGGWNELGARNIVVKSGDNTATVDPAKVTAPDSKAHTQTSSWAAYDGTITIPADGNYVLEFAKTTNNQNQIAIADIRLFSIPASELAKIELEKAINGVNVPTANVGEGAFQYPAAAIAEINNKIETAKSVLENATSAEEIEAQVEIVNAIEIPALNAPEAGKRYTITNVSVGFAHKDKVLTFIAGGRNDQGNYGIKYKASNANYAQAFIFEPTGEKNTYTLSQYDADGAKRYLALGSAYTGNDEQIRTITDAEKAAKFEIVPMDAEGNWQIKNVAANKLIGSTGNDDLYTSGNNYRMVLAEAVKATATLKVSDSKYATFVAPFAVAIPSGVKAYTTSSLEDNSELVLNEITGTIPANTPVILSAENTPVNETVSGWGLATTDEYTSGLLTGVYSEVTAPNGSYVLQNQTGRVAFFVVDTEKASPKVTANHAYLTAPTSAAAKILKFPSDKATSIAEVANPMSNVKAIYSVSGAKVNTLQKGLNIVKYNNGQMKKVYIK